MKPNLTKIIGYILLIPSLISVLMFLSQLFIETELFMNLNNTIWTGKIRVIVSEGGGGGGHTSALPFYFGLMAIAGAYLIKDRK
jgi:hypothetical protein